MKSLQKIGIPFVAALYVIAMTVIAMAAQQHENLIHFSAVPGDSPFSIKITWTVKPDIMSQIDYFELRKKVGNGSYRSIEIDSNDGNTYAYEDNDLYKGPSEEEASLSESVVYELWVYYKTDSPGDSGHLYAQSEVLEYSTNAVRRTWGSIKSMFQ